MAKSAQKQWRYLAQGDRHVVVRLDSRIIADFVDTAAHAKLMAAAPDLLAALMDIAVLCEAEMPCEIARAAIAKARGEE